MKLRQILQILFIINFYNRKNAIVKKLVLSKGGVCFLTSLSLSFLLIRRVRYKIISINSMYALAQLHAFVKHF